jgi:P-type conjugative transfer protein TrbG
VIRLIRGAGRAGVLTIGLLSMAAVPSWAQLPPPKPIALGQARPAVVAPAAAPAGPASAATPASTLPHRPFKRRKPTAAMSAVHQAYARAITEPTAANYVNAGLVYDYDPGKLYTIHTSPRFLTVIALRPGEKLISKAAGDTVRWVLGETQQGGGDRAQVLILVKPVEGGLRTNIVLTTDQRVYLLEAVSHEEPYYTSLMSWHYPQDDMRDVRLAQAATTVDSLARTNNVVATGLSIDKLRFDYRVAPQGRGAAPRWTPVRVFDDGAKTYIQFPTNLASTDAPPLFLIGSTGAAELVNYRFSNGYYIVDRLIDVAELRLGDKPRTVVRITFTGARG